MCAVSVIYDMFGKQPDNWYTLERISLFKRMVADARQFDNESGQPDCEDAEKALVNERIEKIEENLEQIVACDNPSCDGVCNGLHTANLGVQK